MKKEEVPALLAALPPNAQITVTVKVRDWVAAIQSREGGPEYASAAEVAQIIGFTPTYWARRARSGRIAGAVQSGNGGRWRLPLAGCREYVELLRRAPTPIAGAGSPLDYRPRAPPAEMERRRVLQASQPRGPYRKNGR
jgi:hypothetical protein